MAKVEQSSVQRMRTELMATERWAMLAVAIGYDPVDVEGQGRDILKRMSAMGVNPVAQRAED